MNKLAKNVTAAGLCAALCLSAAGAAFAKTTEKTQQTSEPVSQSVQTAQTEEQPKTCKNETVYVLAGADGSVQKLIVSDWLKNTSASDIISDRSELSDIENVKGDESYTLDESNMSVWDAQGNDIYYQGSLEKELPVDLRLSYQLDGKTISAEALAGQSGKVTIRFDYQNNQYETVQIDGKEENIHVPFAMLTGVLLDSDRFRNVQVTNGTLLNDADHTIVVGLAFPGLQENLAIDRQTLEIPDYVEITADVTDFALDMTVTVATNEVFNELDTERISALNVDEPLRELTDAMTQLLDGTSSLYDGLCTLLEQSGELATGAEALAEGAKTLKDGAEQLSGGADQLATGTQTLSAGLDTLSSGSADLNAGAEQAFSTLLSTATAQLRAAGLTIPDLTAQNYETVLTGILSSLGEAASSEAGRTITELKASLDSYNAFYLGLLSYTGGVDEAAAGAGELNAGAAALKTGTTDLKTGAESLYSGASTLQNGMPSLLSGITQLRDGAMSLRDGMQQLNEEGMEKLVGLIDENADGIAARLKATVEVSRGYTNFSGVSDDMDAQVKFIYRTEQIEQN